MIHTVTVALPPAAILEQAKRFFAERVPNMSAFPEKEGPQYLILRGQGGEEVAINARALDASNGSARTHLRVSTLFFDQGVDRFLSILPLESDIEVK
ncbi:MAG TPA: hypothetical protein VN848_01395 [Gemmatimonadales bacterium]|nr:hypothetical protein [Gemmatimonadales bacterium]